jgi:ATP-dependent RNA helicase DbpA
MSLLFDALPLRAELREALIAVGYTEMTPIQARALPHLLRGRDVTGQASTGSGKTAAFGLALLQRLDLSVVAPQALVLCPTRELAEQVGEELRRLASRLPNNRVVCLTGGRPNRDQKRALEGGCHVVVGTPGRVGKHLGSGDLDLSALRVLVLDEADRMLDMGFVDEVEAIIAQCPTTRQTLLFSATFPAAIDALRDRVQHDPMVVAVQAQVSPELLQQLVFRCGPDRRHELVARLLATYRPTSSLVFCETREECDALTEYLRRQGAVALTLHGQKEQTERDDVLVQLTNGSASVLVATNVAARGLDIPSLPAVIIAELSHDPESHLHRVGRTGRAGEAGLALSIVASPHEEQRLQKIEEFLERPIPNGPEPGPSQRLEGLNPPNRTLLILAGRNDRLSRGDVLGALVKDGGIPAGAIGRLDLGQKTCAVAVSRDYARQALKYLQGGRVKGQRVRATLLG